VRSGFAGVLSLWLLVAAPSAGQTTFAFRGELLEAIVQFGFARGAPIGLEVVDWAALRREVDVRWSEDESACAVLSGIVGETGLAVEAEGQGCLIRPSSPRESVLDTLIRDFAVHRQNLRMLDLALYRFLDYALDPSPRTGFVGSIPIPAGTPSLGPLDLGQASVRRHLMALVVVAPGGGLWLADGRVRATGSVVPPLWRIVSYRQERDHALRELRQLSLDRERRPID